MLHRGRKACGACLQLRLEEVFFGLELPDLVQHDLVHLDIVRGDFWSQPVTQRRHLGLSHVLVLDLAVQVYPVAVQVVDLFFLLFLDVDFVLVCLVLPDAVLVSEVALELGLSLLLLFSLVREEYLLHEVVSELGLPHRLLLLVFLFLLHQDAVFQVLVPPVLVLVVALLLLHGVERLLRAA